MKAVKTAQKDTLRMHFLLKEATIFYALHKGGIKEAVCSVDHPHSPFFVLHHVVCYPIISEELDGELKSLGIGKSLNPAQTLVALIETFWKVVQHPWDSRRCSGHVL